VRSEGNRFIVDLSCASAESSSTRFCKPREVNELLSSRNKGMKPDEIDRCGGALLGVVVTSMASFYDSQVVRYRLYTTA
jgi:hypothetical protein